MRIGLALALSAAVATVPLMAQTSKPAAAPEAPAKQPFDKAQAEAVVLKLATELDENFVFPDKGKAYAARLREQLAAGAYASFADGQAFATKVTADLQAVHKDGHLKLMSPETVARLRASPASADGTKASAIDKSGWLAPGVAYISFRDLPGDQPTMAALRSFLAKHFNAKTLIVDLRENRGGGLDEMDLLFPQLFAKPTDLVVMDTRAAFDTAHGSPFGDDLASLRLEAGPDGVVRRVHHTVPAAAASGLRTARVFLLTSNRTVSAGEHFSLSLKRTKRATLIGETTRGAGHYGTVEQLPAGYAAFIPVGRTFDPDTGEGWEGIGVAPDIAVPADRALDEALKLAGVNASGDVALAALR